MSTNDDQNIAGQFDRLVGNAERIKFPTGVFGKTCMTITIFSASCGAIAWATGSDNVGYAALAAAAIVALYGLNRAFNFANSHPSAAILEGAEFVKHEQIMLAAKGMPHIADSGIVSSYATETPRLEAGDNSSADRPEVEMDGTDEG